MNRFIMASLSLCLAVSPLFAAEKKAELDTRPHIDVVFAIDCSGSMGGVIDTAKQKIWSIVNEIAKAKPSPVLRIGLHGYGNGAATFRNFPLTDDLDQVYADLMTFKDEGWGSEFVGLSVQKTTREMDWKDWEKIGASNVLRVLYVVGNETAEQGPISYKTTAPEALKKQIYVNAIYCGEGGGPPVAMNRAVPKVQSNVKPNSAPAKTPQQPNQAANAHLSQNQKAIAATMAVPGFVANTATQIPPLSSEIETWREMARLGGGEFSQIAASGGGVTINTPYDQQFTTLNNKLNGTYLAYGAKGESLKGRQVMQDSNSLSIGGVANLAARANAKAQVQYNNRAWDLIDASREKDFDLAKIPKEQLPAEMRTLSPDEQKKFIEKKSAERAALQKEITALNRKREDYIAAELKKKNMNLDQALDEQILRTIRTQAQKRGFKF